MEVLQPHQWQDLRIDYFYARLVAGTLLLGGLAWVLPGQRGDKWRANCKA